mmetsp:Transcript_18253/g.44820  ORF Transcript_18253/g.44820 Transcript_18253/m.44820 type:complete len:444 (-) Transcript_18253:241-1572(-)
MRFVERYGPKAHEEVGKKFPEGVHSWYYPRKQLGAISLLADVLNFAVWHYMLWGLVAFASLCFLYLVGMISKITAYFIFIMYWVQVVVYKPQVGRGWSPLCRYVLNSSFLDLGLCYLDAWLVREAELDPKRQYMFGWAPHGLLGVCRTGSAGSWWNEAFPGIFGRWGSFGMAYYIPGAREFSLLVGAVDASKEVLRDRIKDGDSIHLLPGGIREMMLTDENSTDTKVVLINRSGFVRLAWEAGLDLVPVYCFGEKWTAKRVLLPYYVRKVMEKFRMAGTSLIGRWNSLLPLIEHPKHGKLSLAWVFGRPITVKKHHVEDLSVEEQKIVKLTFDTIDTNKNGEIDAEKLLRAAALQIEGSQDFPKISVSLKRLAREMKKEKGSMMDLRQFRAWWQGEKMIEKLHGKFVSEMKRIFDTYKSEFGYGPEETLTFVDPSKSEYKKKQ